MPVGTDLYKSVQVSTKFLGFGTLRTVQVSTGLSELVQDGTRPYKSVPDFLYRYRTVQDSTSRYQISGTGHCKGWYKMVQVGTLFPLVLCVQPEDCRGQYKSVQDFLNGYPSCYPF